MKKINLGVVFGSRSKEHEVSLSSAMGVINALDKEKYNVIPIAITKEGNWLIGEKGDEYMKLNAASAGKENAISSETSQALVKPGDDEGALVEHTKTDEDNNKIDLILPILHGPYGEDGKIQGMLDMMKVSYVFSGVLAHALGMNKSRAKIIAQNVGVPVAESMVLNIKDKVDIKKITDQIALPMMVKPNELGSSVGISIAKNEDELKKAVDEAFELGNEVIVEQYVKGREFTVTVIGDNNPEALPIIEIIPVVSEFYDYQAKYEDGGSKHVCPAELSDELTEKAQDYAVKVFKAIGCQDLSRVDFVFDEKKQEFYFIDINTIPGMTPTSLAPEAAKEAGMDFGKFLDRLIEGAVKRHKK